MNTRLGFVAVAFIVAAAPFVAQGEDAPPAFLARHRTDPADTRAIENLLATYTTSVADGDRAAFEALLLNQDVPFSSTYGLVGPGADPAPVNTRRYDQFRQSIFESGVRYRQRFYNVHIQQDGDLAEVSLDFITEEAATGRGGYGWKTLQLLKVQGQWKIASEFYTGRPLPKAS